MAEKDLTPEELDILKAWMIAGRVPPYHREQQRRLAREWPVLYRAVQAIVQKAGKKRA